MANISYGGHSFIIDGQHTWLACGSIDYARVPHRLWRERVRAAKQAGLNCVQTSVFWDLHEPQPGTFRFEDQMDLRRFLHVLEEEGLWCLLRPGPFVGGGWDLGGLPPWLLERPRSEKDAEPVRLRQSSPRFLQAVARYLDAVMSRVRDLQATEPQGGPLILIQCEHEWFSQNDKEAEGYLQQINRFLRESGCAVPLINTNNLYQQVPGTIDGWDGDGDIFANCRQLRVLQPDAPCVVTSLPAGGPDTWGRDREEPQPAEQLFRRMVQVSAAGGMFNLEPFCGGTNFGFHGGRLEGDDDSYVTTSHDAHAPLSETGARREKYEHAKRFCTFLTQFGSLMGNLNPQEHHTVAATGLSVIQQSGSLGDVVFILNDDPEREGPAELTTPDGQSLPVELNGDPAAWIVRDANLGGVATLNITNLRPWAFLGRRLLVLFGPAGSDALLSIDGTLLAGEVPKGNTPLVMQQDNITVAVLNHKQVDGAYPVEDGVYVGIGGLDEEEEPMPHRGFGSYVHVGLEGEITKHRHGRTTPPTAPKLGQWTRAALDPYLKGTAPRYATIEGPRSLEACGADFGYGWYRVRVKRSRAKKVNLFVPNSGDRLHLYVNGKFSRIIGHGPSAAAEPVPFNFPSGETELVFLADNLGRFSEGLGLERPEGVCGHLLDLKTVRLSKPERSVQPRINPFELSGYVPRCAADDRSPYPRYTFSVNLTSKKEQLVLLMSGERPRSVILVNDEPVALDVGEGVTASYTLDEHLKKGKNRITLALIDLPEDEDPEGEAYDPRDNAALYRVAENLSEGANWWYARWQIPDLENFRPMPGSTPSTPAFYRTTFSVSRTDVPLMLQVDGPSKGQIYLNGHNVGRYFVATHTGKKVPPQRRYYLPGPWLSEEEENELILFDEHGKSPSRCSLVYDPFGPFGEEEEE